MRIRGARLVAIASLALLPAIARGDDVRPRLVQVEIDATADRRPISPLIYGAANVGEEDIVAAGITLLRWGGNPATRYNWKLGNAWNAAADWHFMNGDYGHKGEPRDRVEAAMCKRLGVEFLLTVPTIGWVAKDTTSRSSKPVGADPRETSVPADPAFAAEWVRRLNGDLGLGVRYFAMDNEPDIWGRTHSDIHPAPAGYDEILSRFLAYASAVKEADPSAVVTGPVSANVWYWFNLDSGAADRQAHGGKDFVPWFLDAVADHDRKTGARTLDILDVHYYPDLGDPAKRLSATRELWDRDYGKPAFKPEVLPRLKRWVAKYYPGTRLAITEYSYGDASDPIAALLQADALGVFGREGLDIAARWHPTPKGSPVHYAFRIFRRPGEGKDRFGDTSVRCASGNPDRLGAYAALDGDGRLTTVLVNKDPDRPARARIALAHYAGRGATRVYLYRAGDPDGIRAAAGPSLDGPTAELLLPPSGMALVVFP